MVDIRKELESSITIVNFPTIALKILEVINDQDSSVHDLAEVIVASPALTAKILNVANSGFYAFEKEITGIHQAISLMGLNAVANIVLSVSVIDALKQNNSSSDLTHYWERSFFTAIAAKMLAKKCEHKHIEEAFISGLLSNISYLFIIKKYPDLFERLMQKGLKEANRMSLELEFFGMTHAEISTIILGLSPIPDMLVKPIEYHHTSMLSYLDNPDIDKLCKIVYCASQITILFYDDPSILSAIKEQIKEMLGLSAEEFEPLTKDIVQKVKESSEFYGFNALTFPTYFEILERANFELSKINLSYEKLLKELKKEKEHSQKLAEKLSETNRKLLEIALKDPLTGAYNRRYLNEVLDRKMSESKRYGAKLVLIYCDIDHFKRINDSYGHNNGDIVLKRIVTIFKLALRNTDVLARTGGEEFSVVCQATNFEDGVLIAEKLREKISSTVFRLNEGQEISVTMSFGVANYDQEISDRESFIKLADDRLYKAKDSGRNCVVSA